MSSRPIKAIGSDTQEEHAKHVSSDGGSICQLHPQRSCLALSLFESQAAVKPLATPVDAPVGNYSPEAAAAAWRASQQSLSMPMVVSCGCDTEVLEPVPSALAGIEESISDDVGTDQVVSSYIRSREAAEVAASRRRSMDGSRSQDGQTPQQQRQHFDTADSGTAAAGASSSNGTAAAADAGGGSSSAAVTRSSGSLSDGGGDAALRKAESDVPMPTPQALGLMQGSR